MRKASWILLTFLGVVIVAFSLLSMWVAYYSPENDVIDGKTFAPSEQKDEAGNVRASLDLPESLETAIRARRGTAAAYAAAFGVLILFVVLGPYRRGDRWAWPALLVSLVVLALLAALRKPALGTSLGVGSPALLLLIGGVALLLDVKRLQQRS